MLYDADGMGWRRIGKTVSVLFIIVAISFIAIVVTIATRHATKNSRVAQALETPVPPSQADATIPPSTTAPPAAATTAPQSRGNRTTRTSPKPAPPAATPPEPETPVSEAPTRPPFLYTFNVPGTFYESGGAAQSASRYWFLDSGAELVIADGHGSTVQGALPSDDFWRETYALSNPTDTDQGYHPQNIFRLLTKDTWGDAVVQSDFLITDDNLSASPNRNESNGLLLMTRYQDHDTLYYAGIRVDGQAVIKKKYHGTYYTLAIAPVYPGTYNHATNPNLIPHDVWIGLASEAQNLPDGSVLLQLSIKEPGGNSWKPLLSVRDDGSFGGTPPIRAAGTAGIRTDFMDVLFRNFRVDTL